MRDHSWYSNQVDVLAVTVSVGSFSGGGGRQTVLQKKRIVLLAGGADW